MVIVSSVRKSVTSSSEAASSIMPTVAHVTRAKYSPQSSVNDQAIDSQTTSPSMMMNRTFKTPVCRSADSVPRKIAPPGLLKYSASEGLSHPGVPWISACASRCTCINPAAASSASATPASVSQPIARRRAGALIRPANARSASSTTRPQTESTVAGARCQKSRKSTFERFGSMGQLPSLARHAVIPVHVGGMPAPVTEQDHADADGHLGRRHGDHEQSEDDPGQGAGPGRRIAVVAPERHEVDVGGVEHDLDGHQHGNGVAPDEHAHQPDRERGGGEVEKPVQRDVRSH